MAAGATERDAARILAILNDEDVLDPDTIDHVRLAVGLAGIDGAVY